MGRSKKQNKNRKRKSNPLFGTEQASGNNSYIDTAKEGGLILLAAIAAGGAGAAIGKHSLIAGVPLTLIGIHRKNKYLIAAGLGLTLSNGFQKPGQSSTTQGVDGFDLKQIAQGAKDRVGTFFENFKGKLYLTPAPVTTAADGIDDEQVTYFVNPYNGTGALDTSAIDRVQEQIAEMNKNVNGLNDMDREF
jgi:hypothetical protein